MKRFLGVAAVVLFGSIPAHAQRVAGSAAGSSSSAALTFSSGTAGGGGITGEAGHLPIYSRAEFATVAFGGDPSFAPSSFMTFENAVKEGIAESAPARTVVQAAADNQAALREKSRVEFVQDHRGNVIPVAR
ncbi:MAG TPA: hypothetical protein VN885_07725 [Candidatus Acidoferrales bacterium]|nr:hypothetical protein [Candidatus Acidoferrales bacterium]